MLLIANVTLFLSALIGMWFILEQNKIGFIIFLLTEASMIYIGVVSGNYGCVGAAFIYFVMNVFSYVKWSRRGL